MSILVVDDDHVVRTTISIILKQNGYTVLEAVDGKDAVRQAKNKTTLLMIVDLFMPNMDGLETIREVRRLAPSLPILAISGSTALTGVPMPDLLRAAVAFGAVSTLPKPFRASELLSAVRSVISMSSSPKPEPLRSG
jgi:CheY-like chemotaxis protein